MMMQVLVMHRPYAVCYLVVKMSVHLGSHLYSCTKYPAGGSARGRSRGVKEGATPDRLSYRARLSSQPRATSDRPEPA